jgi:hypothetical protein
VGNQLKSTRLIVTTGTDGAGTVYGEKTLLGWLVAVQWIDGDLADGVDAVLSVDRAPSPAPDRTLLTLTDANADAWYYPRALEHDVAGAALTTYTLLIIEGRLKLVIADGGDTKTGGCIVYYTDR